VNVRGMAQQLVAFLAVILAPALAVSPVAAQTGGGANNVVQVVSTADDPVRSGSSVQATPYAGDSAQSTNLARAEAHDCTGCRSHAAALQAVFLTGDPSTVQVANAAVATNSNCTSCVTYAYAYQYVITTEGPVSLSPDGRQQIASLNAEAREVIAQQLDPSELDLQLEALGDRLREIVDSELRAQGLDATTKEVVRDRQVASTPSSG
jgi:putative peptide zinc metalloprotease protein